jgi:hypothetical protein
VPGHLALVLQGAGGGPYTAPVFVPSLALREIGAQVEIVPYPDFRPGSLESEDARDFNDAVTTSLLEIVRGGTWSRITFVAKSVGALYLATLTEPMPCDRVDAVWVTPPLGLDYVRAGVLGKAWPSLIVAGAADPYHDAAAHADVCTELEADDLVIEDADHGLTVAGDVRRTIDGYRALADATLAFATR